MIGFAPVRMQPAFRFGKDTPWGGTGLSAFGKAIPDDHTGESLEVSALPGLESRDEAGTPLTALLERHGSAFRGTAVEDPFPLLLKLIAPEDWLSVQVHPDDAYAAAHEGGKLGKTEAWVILSAAPGAQIVYGLMPGATRAQLEEACAQGGEALKRLLRFVPVHAGEVYNIPAGTVHALGKGVTVAEIQQSSDVTYRFYDWDRRDAQGRSRPLHIAQGLDVARLGVAPERSKGEPLHLLGAEGLRFVDGPAFTLDRVRVNVGWRLFATPERFRLMTALSSGMMLCGEERIPFAAGESFFLPALLYDTVVCAGTELLMMEPRTA